MLESMSEFGDVKEISFRIEFTENGFHTRTKEMQFYSSIDTDFIDAVETSIDNSTPETDSFIDWIGEYL